MLGYLVTSNTIHLHFHHFPSTITAKGNICCVCAMLCLNLAKCDLAISLICWFGLCWFSSFYQWILLLGIRNTTEKLKCSSLFFENWAKWWYDRLVRVALNEFDNQFVYGRYRLAPWRSVAKYEYPLVITWNRNCGKYMKLTWLCVELNAFVQRNDLHFSMCLGCIECLQSFWYWLVFEYPIETSCTGIAFQSTAYTNCIAQTLC